VKNVGEKYDTPRGVTTAYLCSFLKNCESCDGDQIEAGIGAAIKNEKKELDGFIP
jgi:hypothetical protein